MVQISQVKTFQVKKVCYHSLLFFRCVLSLKIESYNCTRITAGGIQIQECELTT